MITREPPRATGPGPGVPPPWLEPFQRAFLRPAVATRSAIVLVAAVSLAAFFVPGLGAALAKDNSAIRGGEVWRLVTVGLVHGNLLHLGMNLVVLSNVGGFVERLLGGGRMLIVLWGGVFTGAVASFLTNPHPSVGVSGGVFALVGALLGIGLRNRRRLPAPLRGMLVRGPIEVILLNLALAFAVENLDHAGHVGGLAGGFLLGLALPLRRELDAALSAADRAAGPRWPGSGGAGYGEAGTAWHRDDGRDG